MSEINKERVKEAVHEMCETFDRLHLTMEERAIVTYSAYITASRFDSIGELVEKTKEKPRKIHPTQIWAAVAGTAALIISTISIITSL